MQDNMTMYFHTGGNATSQKMTIPHIPSLSGEITNYPHITYNYKTQEAKFYLSIEFQSKFKFTVCIVSPMKQVYVNLWLLMWKSSRKASKRLLGQGDLEKSIRELIYIYPLP